MGLIHGHAAGLGQRLWKSLVQIKLTAVNLIMKGCSRSQITPHGWHCQSYQRALMQKMVDQSNACSQRRQSTGWFYGQSCYSHAEIDVILDQNPTGCNSIILEDMMGVSFPRCIRNLAWWLAPFTKNKIKRLISVGINFST